MEGSADLGAALWDQWPSYFGYALSFMTIGIMWINHHGQYKDIERVDHTSLVLNLLLLMCVAFVPFPAAVLAAYLEHDEQLLAATLLYGGTFTLIGIIWNALWLYSSIGRRLIDPHISDTRLRSRTRRNLAAPIFYGLGLPLALIDPWIALGLYTALAVLYLLPVNG